MLTPQEAFLKAIQEQPDDDGPRLMYADWLEERGDPRGEFIRVQCQLAHTPSVLPDWDRLAKRERALLTQFGPTWAGPLPRLVRLHPMLQDVFHRGLLRPALCRQVATEVVRTKDAAQVIAQIKHAADDPHLHDFFACLLQELVMKEGEVATPAAVRLAQKLGELEHPLAVLPLQRLDLELPPPPLSSPEEEEPRREHRRPNRRTRPPPGQPYAIPRRSHPPVTFRDVTGSGEALQIATAVRNWEKESGGEWQAAVFRAGRPLSPRQLSLDVLQSLDSDFPVATRASWVLPGEVWAALFEAASLGGASNRGHGAAYGRLEAWESFAALMGAPAHERPESLARRAEDCLWIAFDTDWFNALAWDVGVMVVRPDGSTVAALAATDAD